MSRSETANISQEESKTPPPVRNRQSDEVVLANLTKKQAYAGGGALVLLTVVLNFITSSGLIYTPQAQMDIEKRFSKLEQKIDELTAELKRSNDNSSLYVREGDLENWRLRLALENPTLKVPQIKSGGWTH
jgi:hypothetical protein